MSTTSQTALITLKDLHSPKPKFLLGNLKEFRKKNKHLILEQWAKEFGKVYTIKLGPVKALVSADPDINNQILKQRPENFRRLSKINEIFIEMGFHTVFNAEGEHWKEQRKIVAEALSVKKVKGYYPIIKEKNEQLYNKITSYTERLDSVEILKDFIAFTIDVTTEIAFGYKLNTINSQKDRFQNHLELIFPKINERISAPIPLWRFIPSKEDKKLNASLKEIEFIVNNFIKEAKIRLENDKNLVNNPSNFLEAMLVESKKEESVFDDTVLYGNVIAMLLAGEDTTSNTLAWTLFYLAQHPEIVEKVRWEAHEFYGTEIPENYDQISLLKYTHAVIQEAIRLSPTTPLLFIQANKDVTINNLFIPENTSILLQNGYSPKSEEYFSEPTIFNPDRWLSSSCPYQNHAPKTIKAFGGGPRLCPGMHLSLIEMVSAISGICKNFDIILDGNPSDIEENFAFTVSPENLRIKFKKKR